MALPLRQRMLQHTQAAPGALRLLPSADAPRSTRTLYALQNRTEPEARLGSLYWVPAAKVQAALGAAEWQRACSIVPETQARDRDPPAPFALWCAHRSYIGLPASLGLSLFGVPGQDARSTAPLRQEIQFAEERVQLRPQQQAALELSMPVIQSAWGASVIQIDTGEGKTILGQVLIQRLRQRALVVCPRTVLMDQWEWDILGKPWTWAHSGEQVKLPVKGKRKRRHGPEAARMCVQCQKVSVLEEAQQCSCIETSWLEPEPPTPGFFPGARVGRLQGAWTAASQAKLEAADIVIASMDSLAQFSYPAEFLRSFGLLLVDEVHTCVTLTRARALVQLPMRYKVGLTATPDRADGAAYGIHWLCGPTAAAYERIPELMDGKPSTVVLPVQSPCPKPELPQDAEYTEILRALHSSVQCMQWITGLVLELLQSAAAFYRRIGIGRAPPEPVRIMLCTRWKSYAEALQRAIMIAGIHDCVLLAGGASDHQKAAAKRARVVVGVDKYVDTGYNDTRLPILMMVDDLRQPVQLKQLVGRIERHAEPLVIDLQHGVFTGMQRERRVWYKSRGYTILPTLKA